MKAVATFYKDIAETIVAFSEYCTVKGSPSGGFPKLLIFKLKNCGCLPDSGTQWATRRRSSRARAGRCSARPAPGSRGRAPLQPGRHLATIINQRKES